MDFEPRHSGRHGAPDRRTLRSRRVGDPERRADRPGLRAHRGTIADVGSRHPPRGGLTLYLVGTPIGHRGDMTPRAREVLGAATTVACEDTRTCRKLFAWLELPA